ncbi:peptide chain release factor N(5)-glutamine methyltransferase [Alkalicoccus chagannorensis]|uniref:peptide chain release factor N(5)-glutamine methyltransferase n=1 Tax=Alkalicoccus chagannorensis TaxID=427072 RepID=UPI00041603F8|nr:peptide chain release factor N(5)-glutamine methyltransferase [Alkalicoccus chagannorensis]
MTTAAEALTRASSFLEEAGREGRIAEVLLLHHTGWSRARLLAEKRAELPVEIVELLWSDVQRAADGMPVQHLTGEETFYGRTFSVNRHVLIPRPETEEVVQYLLERLPENASVLDVGTGSGILAVTIKKERPDVSVTAVDISRNALETAAANAAALEADVTFLESDLLDVPIRSGSRFDAVISNPPYVPETDRLSMAEHVTSHEPELALFAGEDGLELYRRLCGQLPCVLRRPGLVVFEIGWNQGDSVAALLQKAFTSAQVDVVRDINQNERIAAAAVPLRG